MKNKWLESFIENKFEQLSNSLDIETNVWSLRYNCNFIYCLEYIWLYPSKCTAKFSRDTIINNKSKLIIYKII